MGTEFDREPVYDKKYLKTKVKFYDGKVNKDFHGENIPKQGPHFMCLSIIVTDSICKMTNNFYPQVFLEECKYIETEKKMIRYITEKIEISDDDSGKEDSEQNSE